MPEYSVRDAVVLLQHVRRDMQRREMGQRATPADQELLYDEVNAWQRDFGLLPGRALKRVLEHARDVEFDNYMRANLVLKACDVLGPA